MFGIQSYIINGVRSANKKGGSSSHYFQPAAILDLVVYHNELKQLQRIKEYKWSILYNHIFSDIKKNAIALYFVELLSKCLKQPETNDELFQFVEDTFMSLDDSSGMVAANLPLFYTLHLPYFFGFRFQDNYSETHTILDLNEGAFISSPPPHPHFLEDKFSETISQLLKVQQPQELEEIPLNSQFRRNLLFSLEKYYALHLSDFGNLKTLRVLHEILN